LILVLYVLNKEKIFRFFGFRNFDCKINTKKEKEEDYSTIFLASWRRNKLNFFGIQFVRILVILIVVVVVVAIIFSLC
jgi:hypothetical protein